MRFNLNKQRVVLILMGLILVWFILQIALSISPWALFRETRNITRQNHLNLIADTVYFYLLRNGKFPDCIPQPGSPAVSITKCPELKDYLTHLPQDPDPEQEYLIEYLTEQKDKIRVYSTSPEAEGIEVIK